MVNAGKDIKVVVAEIQKNKNTPLVPKKMNHPDNYANANVNSLENVENDHGTMWKNLTYPLVVSYRIRVSVSVSVSMHHSCHDFNTIGSTVCGSWDPFCRISKLSYVCQRIKERPLELIF
ncbi:hypothetical protein DVH24_017966 [Malus domestica]|uniref:Uncharacterized protein n=1 Tax=Malus domestica TaxID=3750 RepID=A0A498KHP1_MALDO|nr:hypothetical protein DVH24_017966 [Malus domestica]